MVVMTFSLTYEVHTDFDLFTVHIGYFNLYRTLLYSLALLHAYSLIFDE
jgi:hypothetical protein